MKSPYIATDGKGTRIECRTFEEALSTITSDIWHIYEWQEWQYVQVY